MAIQTQAGIMEFVVTGRGDANPSYQISDMNPTTTLSYGVAVRVANNFPIELLRYNGNDGSNIIIGHDGFQWYMSVRQGGVVQTVRYFNNINVNIWAIIGITVLNHNLPVGTPNKRFRVYYGEETGNTKIVISNVIDVLVNLTTVANDITLNVQSSAVCNFKVWNSVLTQAQLQEQLNVWSSLNLAFTPLPFWESTLRTPGDLSSIANPNARPVWNRNHAYYDVPAGIPIDQNSARANLNYVIDPQYLNHFSECPTWVYPLIPGGIASFSPGNLPLVQTTYKAPQLFDMDDRGAIDLNGVGGSQITQVFGLHSNNEVPGVTVPPLFTWVRYVDENGVEHSNAGDPAFSFENNSDGGVDVVAEWAVSNTYLWKYGAQFTWPGSGATIPAAIGFLQDFHLLVLYVGTPTGIPGIPFADMSGLFAINKGGPSHDKYNRGQILKIPDPTVRTALIGE